MNDYIESLEKDELQKLCKAMAEVLTQLGTDGDVHFCNEDEDEDVRVGFYCLHSGEPLLED